MSKIKKSFQKIFAIFTLVISFALCLSLADLFSSLITVGTFNNEVSATKNTAYSAFAISLYNSSLKSSASEFAISVQKNGGAGYVWEEGGTHYVIASVYLEKNDAELVKENIKSDSVTPEVLKLDFPEIQLENSYDSNQIVLVNSLLDACKSAYQKLYDVSISLDTGLITETEAKLEIGAEASNKSKLLSDFAALFPSNLSNDLLLLKINCADIVQLLEELVHYVPSNLQTLSSKIKYNYTKILDLNRRL